MSMRPDDHRRKWDKEEFEKIAAERLKAELEEEEKSKKKGKILVSTHFVTLKYKFEQHINICLIFIFQPLQSNVNFSNNVNIK